MERIASAVRLGKIAGRLERRERRDGGSFLLDSRNVSISLIEGLSHGKRVNSIYSRVGGMARWTERKERERERGGVQGVDGGCHNHRDASNHPQPPTPSSFGRTDEGLKGSRKRGMRERERICVRPIIARLSAGATSS